MQLVTVRMLEIQHRKRSFRHFMSPLMKVSHCGYEFNISYYSVFFECIISIIKTNHVSFQYTNISSNVSLCIHLKYNPFTKEYTSSLGFWKKTRNVTFAMCIVYGKVLLPRGCPDVLMSQMVNEWWN